jgi:hypothetical protein
MRFGLLAGVLCALLLCLTNPTEAAAACQSAAYHQFDFFVGRWDVTNPAGEKIGTDEVSKAYGACVLVEKWHDGDDSGGGIGLTGYSIGHHSWHQDFMDDTGFVLTIDGGMVGSKMIMTGADYLKTGVRRLHRVVWTTRADGSVEEVWKTSVDGGATWQPHFDGIFRKRTST